MKTFDADAGAGLKTAFEALVADWAAVTEHAMFGHPSYKAGGTIFALLRTEAVVLTRLPESRRERLAAEFPVQPFEANGGTIERWVVVSAGPDDLANLESYVRASHEAALTESRTVPPPADEE